MGLYKIWNGWLGRSSAAHLVSGTDTAPTASGRRYASVGFGKWVACMAVGFATVSCTCANPSQDVHAICDRLKMSRIDTGTGSAKMVDSETVRDRPEGHLVGHTVGWSLWMPESAIAIAVTIAGPQPAGFRLYDLAPEPVCLIARF